MSMRKYTGAVALVALVFGGQPVLAQQAAVQPVQGEVAAAPAGPPAEGQVEATVGGEAAEPAQQQEMAAPGEAAEEHGAVNEDQGMAVSPGMQHPWKKGCRMGKDGMTGMMRGAMGRGGMMRGGMGKGCPSSACAGHAGISRKQYRELMGRLDVLDARMAKIDAMLERLLKR